MTFRIGVSLEGNKKHKILIDIITSVAYFKIGKIEVQEDGQELIFRLNGHLPNEYLFYLNRKYELSVDYI